MTTRLRLTAAIAGAALLAFLAAPAGASPSKQTATTTQSDVARSTSLRAGPGGIPDGCPWVYLLGARGSGQRDSDFNGLGEQVNGFKTRLQQNLKNTRRPMAVNALTNPFYPAHDVLHIFTGALSPNNTYFDGIVRGTHWAVQKLVSQQTACPGQRFVIAGYSQGAMVMHRTVTELAARGYTDILAHLDGIVLLADGDRYRNTRANLVGDAPTDGIGIKSWMVGEDEPDIPRGLASRAWEVCRADDVVCDFHASALKPDRATLGCGAFKGCRIHIGDTYIRSPLIDRVAKQVAAAIPTPPEISEKALPQAVVGSPYSAKLTAVDYRPGRWTVTGGSLPPGVTLGASTGRLTGTPAAAGSWPFTVTFTDSDGYTDVSSRSISVTESAGPSGFVVLGTDASTSPSGRFVSYSPLVEQSSGSYTSSPDIYRIDRTTGTKVRVSTNTGGCGTNWGWVSNNGDVLYRKFCYDDVSVSENWYLWDGDTHEATRVPTNADQNHQYSQVVLGVLTADGSQVIFNTDTDLDPNDGIESKIYRWTVATGDLQPLLDNENTPFRVVAAGDDGRFVLLDDNHGTIKVLDTADGTTQPVVEPYNGGSASYADDVTTDGRYVVFTSESSSLVPGDTNLVGDVFVRDMVQGTFERVSVTSDGVQGDGDSYFPSISDDGRYVAFETASTGFFPSHPGGGHGAGVVRFDRRTHTLQEISLGSTYPVITADGNRIFFNSSGTGDFGIFTWPQ